MKVVKQTDNYTVYEKRSGRYAVKDAARKWVLAEDKTKILVDEGLVKLPEPKAEEPEEAEAGEGENEAASEG